MKMSKEEIDRWSKEPFVWDDGSKWAYEHNCKCWKARKEAGLVEHIGATGEIITVIAIILLFMICVCPAIA